MSERDEELDDHEYRCICGWRGKRSALTLHPRQGFGVCPRCWRSGTERIPQRWEPVRITRRSHHAEMMKLANEIRAYDRKHGEMPDSSVFALLDLIDRIGEEAE